MVNVSKYIFGKFYGLSLQKVSMYMLLLIFLWLLIQFIVVDKMHQRILWKCVNILGSIGMIAVILVVTLTSRENVSELVLLPFASLAEARIQPEIYRSMFMNIFLFFPLGLTLPFALPEKWGKKALIAILFALFFSMNIEFLQYCFHLGCAETDDVLCNTLGCAIGTIAFLCKNKSCK